VKADCQHATNFPCDPYALRLFPFRPDEIEEERRTENERNVNAGPDVVGSCSDVIVVADNDSVVADSLDLALT
jgi:hypothetical protein